MAWMGFTSAAFPNHNLTAMANQTTRAQRIDASIILAERALGIKWSAHVYSDIARLHMTSRRNVIERRRVLRSISLFGTL